MAKVYISKVSYKYITVDSKRGVRCHVMIRNDKDSSVT